MQRAEFAGGGHPENHSMPICSAQFRRAVDVSVGVEERTLARIFAVIAAGERVKDIQHIAGEPEDDAKGHSAAQRDAIEAAMSIQYDAERAGRGIDMAAS